MDSLLDKIEDLKEKLTSEVYLELMTALQTVRTKSLLYNIEIFYPKLVISDNELHIVTKHVTFIQKDISDKVPEELINTEKFMMRADESIIHYLNETNSNILCELYYNDYLGLGLTDINGNSLTVDSCVLFRITTV